MISDAALVIAAGGSGSRYGAGNKLFAVLAGLPVAAHSVRRLGPLFRPECRIMAVPEAEMPRFADMLDACAPETPFRLVAGGATRAESVRNALAAIPAGVRYAAIHDAARPLATPELLELVLAAARETGGAVPGRAVIDTLKRCGEDGLVAETVSREALFAVETPQCFDLALLLDAYRRCAGAPTDDAGVMEAAGHPVRIVPDPGFNIKLTRPEDLGLLAVLTKDGPGHILM